MPDIFTPIVSATTRDLEYRRGQMSSYRGTSSSASRQWVRAVAEAESNAFVYPIHKAWSCAWMIGWDETHDGGSDA